MSQETRVVKESDILKTPSLIFVKKPISAWHFFERLAQSISRNQALADEWFVHEAWEVAESVQNVNDGIEVEVRPLTDNEYESLSFRVRGKLEFALVDLESRKTITCNDDAESLEETSDFTTADGQRFTEAPNAGKYFSEFKVRLAKNEGHAFLWAIQAFVLCNGEPISIEQIKDPFKIGYQNAILLYAWLKSFLA